MSLPRPNPNLFSSLFRFSNFASYDSTLPVLYQASNSHAKEFGLKRPLFNYQSPLSASPSRFEYITLQSKRLDGPFGALDHEQGFEAFHRWNSLCNWASQLPAHKVKLVQCKQEESSTAATRPWTDVGEIRQAFRQLDWQPRRDTCNYPLVWNTATLNASPFSSCEPVQVQGRLLGPPAPGSTLQDALGTMFNSIQPSSHATETEAAAEMDIGMDVNTFSTSGWAVNVAGWIAHWPQTEPRVKAGDLLLFDIQQLAMDTMTGRPFITLSRSTA